MPTDPFDGVGEFQQELGQPTFVELIYVKQRVVKPAVPKRRPGVSASVARLAFGRPYGHGTHDPASGHTLKAIPPRPKALKYPINGGSGAAALRAERIAGEFSTLVKNSLLPFDSGGCDDGLANSVQNPTFENGLANWVNAATGAAVPVSSWDSALKALVVGNPTLDAQQLLFDLPPGEDLKAEADFAALGPALPGRWWKFTLSSSDVLCLNNLVTYGSDHTEGSIWAALLDSSLCPGSPSYGRVRVFMNIATDSQGQPTNYMLGLGFGVLENSSTTLRAEEVNPEDFSAVVRVKDPAAPQTAVIEGTVVIRAQRIYPPIATPAFWPVCTNLPLLLSANYNGKLGTLYWNGNGWYGQIAGAAPDGISPQPVFVGLNNYNKVSPPLSPDTVFQASIKGGRVRTDALPASTCTPFRQEFNVPDTDLANVVPGSLVVTPATAVSELRMSVKDGRGNTLNSKTFSAAQVGTRVAVPFTVPSGGKAIVYFQGVNGATAKVTNVSCCVPASLCGPGQKKISYQNFEDGRGSWAGGTLSDGAILLGEADRLQQTFIDLSRGVRILCSVATKLPGGFVIEFHSSMQTDTYTSSDHVGVHTFATHVPPDETLTVIIKSKASFASIGEILLCEEVVLPCDTGMTNLRTFVEWQGIPRQPTNIFNMFARITFRNPSNPFRKKIIHLVPLKDGRLGLSPPASCTQKTTCDFWKQQGDSGTPQDVITNAGLAASLLGTIKSGQVASVKSRRNWLWSVPASIVGTVQDSLVTLWPDSGPGLIESIEFFILMQNVNLLSPGDSGACQGDYICGPDPANEFKFFFRYKNAKGVEREFGQTMARTSLYQVHTADTDTWAILRPLGFGLRGLTARWESFFFLLDTVDGKGLDQCSTPLVFTATGTGTLNFKKPRMSGLGQITSPCEAKVDVEAMEAGFAINEIQEVILPRPAGGRWKLTVHKDGVDETAILEWDSPPEQVKARLGRLENTIGDPDNVKVTGTGGGTGGVVDSYKIEFQNDLAGRTFRLMKGDGGGLTGINDAYVVKLQKGTKNERQTIRKNEGVTASLTIAFWGRESVPIPHNASLNAMQAALEAIPTIGAGNVVVEGNIVDRTAPYQGPWHVDFQGTFAGQNVSKLDPRTPGYSVVVAWQGSVGANDIQQIVVVANSGTFKLTLKHPDNNSTATTGDIPAQATARAVARAIAESVPWIIPKDIIVEEVRDRIPNQQSWTVEFTNRHAAKLIPLMTIDGSKLKGGDIVVRRLQEGSGNPAKQKVIVRRANGGTYRLSVTIGNRTDLTAPIVWGATPQGLEETLTALFFFEPGDVTVKGNESTNPNVSASYVVIFHRKFGDVPLMVPIYEGTLLCDPTPLPYVQPPPYGYPLEDCDEVDEGCNPQHPLCRPGEGDDIDEEEEKCLLRESADVATQLVFQRDLFDPNQEVHPGEPLTIRDVIHKKGLEPGDYVPYLRGRGTLSPTDYSKPVETKMQVLLIEAAIDNATTRKRILQHLRSHRHIMPMRMVWRPSYGTGVIEE